jgi:hypothetical protein
VFAAGWRRRRLVVGVLLGVALAGCASDSPRHSGGDPGGTVLKDLQAAVETVPAGSGHIHRSATDATWQAGCSDGTGHAGWGAAQATTRFVTAESESAAIANIDTSLSRLGWTRHDLVVTTGQGPIPHWTKVLDGLKRANAFAYPVPAGSSQWFLTASWQPVHAVDHGDCA